MSIPDILLATAVFTGDDHTSRYEIRSWGEYGVVCPYRLTTNGSLYTLITCLPWTWAVEVESHHPLVPAGDLDPWELFDGLAAAQLELFPGNPVALDREQTRYQKAREAMIEMVLGHGYVAKRPLPA